MQGRWKNYLKSWSWTFLPFRDPFICLLACKARTKIYLGADHHLRARVCAVVFFGTTLCYREEFGRGRHLGSFKLLSTALQASLEVLHHLTLLLRLYWGYIATTFIVSCLYGTTGPALRQNSVWRITCDWLWENIMSKAVDFPELWKLQLPLMSAKRSGWQSACSYNFVLSKTHHSVDYYASYQIEVFIRDLTDWSQVNCIVVYFKICLDGRRLFMQF